MCMSVARMSQLIKHVDGCLHYRCGNCAIKEAGEPASGSLPLSVLHLYALVGTGGATITPLHAKPARLIVDAPPAERAWGRELPDDHRSRFDPLGVSPKRVRDSRGEHWRYSSAASDAIWRHAASYRGVPSAVRDRGQP